MRVEKNNFKKIVSYLLIFAVFLSTIQLGNIRNAKAADTASTSDNYTDDKSQVPGLDLYVGNKVSGTKIIDGNDQTGYVCEPIDTGVSFYLAAKDSYTITNVVSSNKTKMKIAQTNPGKEWAVSTITDYTDFVLTVTIKDASGAAKEYPITMKFNVDAALQFQTLNVSIDGEEAIPFDYADLVNNTFNMGPVESTAKTAKIQMLDRRGNPIEFSVDNKGASNQATVNLTDAVNTINITRTYSGVSKQYKLIINKKGVGKLKSLVTSAGALSPTFNSEISEYTLVVPTATTKITFTPTALDNASTITVNGSTVASGRKSRNINLDEGENEVTIVVTTAEGEQGTYTINITRTEQFRSAQLTGLTLTGGKLTPAFNKGVYEYTAIVENNITSVGVKPVAEDANATIMINGKQVPSGATSPYISLDEGGNVINIRVTDSKGNTNTYVITVNRRYSKDNVNLDNLTVTDGTMSPKFDPENYLYSVKVPRYVEKVKVKYTSQNDKSKVKINGKQYTSGQSDFIKLELGANLVTVDVTAEDGKSTTTYKLSVIRGEIEGTNDWILDAGDWTFYNAAGIQAKNQWVKYDNQWYFMDINGHMKTGWIYESGKYYYLNDNGIMQTGWFYDKGYWYYLQGNGVMNTYGWYTYDGKWYFFNNFGQVQTGWTLYLGKWYFLDDHGAMQKGWVTWDKNKYYINDDGGMRTGWLYTGKAWFYLAEEDGKMVRGWRTINGKRYYFDSTGAMKTGMFFLDGQWINLNNA